MRVRSTATVPESIADGTGGSYNRFPRKEKRSRGKTQKKSFVLLTILCSIAVAFFVLWFRDESNQDPRVRNNKPIMHTYFHPLGAEDKGKRNMLRAWESSWRARGWSTRVLDEEDAKKHKHYLFVKTVLENCGVDAFSRQGFYRWLAMAAATHGIGGWMADYDTLPLTLTGIDGTKLADKSGGTFTSFSNHIPSLMYANASEWDRVFLEMYRLLPEPDEEHGHISDMRSLLNFTKRVDRAGIHFQNMVWEEPYPKQKGGNLLALDCSTLQKKLAIHFSPRLVGEHFRVISFGKGVSVDTQTDAIVRRGDAARQLMSYYARVCL